MAPRFPAERIFVQCPSWVGDTVMATPALRCLRRNYPDAEITGVVRPGVRRVLADAPWFDDVLEYDPHTRPRTTPGLRATAMALRRKRPDLAVLLTHSLRSAVLARLTGAPRRVAMTRGDQAFLLTDAIPWPRERGKRIPIPKVRLYNGIMRYLECDGWDDQRQELHFSREQDERIRELTAARGADAAAPLICVVPGATFGPSKQWFPDRFAQVADALAKRISASVAMIAAPRELPLAREIADMMTATPVIFEEGEMDLGLLKPLVARSSLMITNDTGPRHYAVALGVPVVVIMGSTDPRNTESDYERTVICRHDVPCGPCHRRRCPLKEQKKHHCMDLVTVDEVLDAAGTLMKKWPPHPFGDDPRTEGTVITKSP